MTNKIQYSLWFSDLEGYSVDTPLPTLEIPVSKSIFEEMSETIYDFQVEWQGKRPAALILSPVAFLQFKFLFHGQYLKSTKQQDIYIYDGVPVYCADTPYRVLPIIPERFVPSYEWKRQQNQRVHQ